MKHILTVCIALAACGNHHDTPATPATPLAPLSTVTAPSTAEQDALWKLAPAGAKYGFVASPRGLALLAGGLETIEQRTSQIPELANVMSELKAVIRRQIGTDNLDFEALGWSRERGFAAFILDESSRVLILPVTNRDKFLAVAGGTKGADSDTLRDMTCKTLAGLYMCANPASLLDQPGKEALASHLNLVGARGDVEFLGADGALELAIVGQLSRGTMIVRGAVKGLPWQLNHLLDGHDVAVDTNGLTGFGIVDIVDKTRMPVAQIVPGVRFDELYAQVAGPLTVTMTADAAELHIPFKDTTLVQRLVEQCAALPALAALGASIEDGACHIPIPTDNIAIDAWVDGEELNVGHRAAPPRGKPIALGPIAEELAKGNWTIAFFGRGTLIGASKFPWPMAAGSFTDEAATMMRAAAFLTELGIGIRKDGDTLRFLVAQRSIFANPDDVVTKLLAISPEDIVAGKSGPAAKAIADAAPSSPFASDLAAGPSGILVPTLGFGIVASLAIPALMDQEKKPVRKTETRRSFETLEKNAKAFYAAHGTFPIGTAKLLPEKVCCPNQCDVTDAWAKDKMWKALEFAIDEPNLFQYTYSSKDGKTAVAKAIGDLDCDGNPIEYRLDLSVENGAPVAKITEPAPNSD